MTPQQPDRYNDEDPRLDAENLRHQRKNGRHNQQARSKMFSQQAREKTAKHGDDDQAEEAYKDCEKVYDQHIAPCVAADNIPFPAVSNPIRIINQPAPRSGRNRHLLSPDGTPLVLSFYPTLKCRPITAAPPGQTRPASTFRLE
jgi:hypothetical protein